MPKWGFFSAVVFLLICSSRVVSSAVVENFSTTPVGIFPSNLKTYPLQHSKATRVYSVQSESGKHFLHAQATGESQDVGVQVFRKFDWDTIQWPTLSWQWRAKSLPVQPSTGHLDDNACAVYVTFGGFGGKAIKYIWSSDFPAGKVIESIPGRFTTVVAQSGPARVGQWQTMKVDVPADYQKFFKKPLSDKPDGIGILTDGDGTHSPSVCDYTNFEILVKQ